MSKDGEKFLPGCVISLKNQNFKNFELVYVDNGSSDKSIEIVRSAFPSARIFPQGKNLGYAKGNNEGWKHCRGEYILLLNDDTILERNTINELVKTLDRNKKIAIAGSVQYFPGEEPNRSSHVVRYFRFFLDSTIVESHKKVEDGHAECFCGLFRKCVFKDKLFDPIYEIGGDDIEVNLRAKYMGYRTVQVLASQAAHYGAKVRPFKAKRFYEDERAGIINHLRFYSVKTLFLMLPIVATDALLKTIVPILTLRFDKLYLRAKALFWVVANLGRVLRARKESQSAKAISDRKYLEDTLPKGKILKPSVLYNRYEIYVRYLKILLKVGLI